MKISEVFTKEALTPAEDKLIDLQSALTQARSITKNIKYVDTHIEILAGLGTLADQHGIELDKYDSDAVLSAKNNLESACYQLEEVFEDAVRDAQNQIDLIDLEQEEEKYGR